MDMASKVVSRARRFDSRLAAGCGMPHCCDTAVTKMLAARGLIWVFRAVPELACGPHPSQIRRARWLLAVREVIARQRRSHASPTSSQDALRRSEGAAFEAGPLDSSDLDRRSISVVCCPLPAALKETLQFSHGCGQASADSSSSRQLHAAIARETPFCATSAACVSLLDDAAVTSTTMRSASGPCHPVSDAIVVRPDIAIRERPAPCSALRRRVRSSLRRAAQGGFLRMARASMLGADRPTGEHRASP